MRRATVWVLSALLLVAGLLLTARDLGAAARFDPLRAVTTSRREVALTFEVTRAETAVPAILAGLGPAHATFFVTGAWAKGHVRALQQIVAEGDEVESLGNRPVALDRYPPTVVRGELAAAVSALTVAGIHPRFLRPVAGRYDPALLQATDAQDLRLCLWDVDGLDWARPGLDAVVQRVLAGAKPGAIVRLQADDSIPDTAAAIPAILRGLAAKGLQPVTLAQLIS